MNKQKVYNYIMNTPHNTNPNVLASLLDEPTSWNDLADKPFGKVFVEVLPKTQLEVIDGTEMGMPGMYIAEIPELSQIAADTAMKVIINSVSYDVKMVETGDDNTLMAFAGNWSLLNEMIGADFEDTGEPFLIGGMSVFTIGNVELSVLAEQIEPVPYEYLPRVPEIWFREGETALDKNFATPTADELEILSEAVMLGNINVRCNIYFDDSGSGYRAYIPARIMHGAGGYILMGEFMHNFSPRLIYINVFKGDDAYYAEYKTD